MEKSENSSKLFRYLALLIAAFVWGTAFVAQSEGSAYVKPFTFTASRAFLGAIVLVPVILIMDGIKKKKHPELPKPTVKYKKTLLIGGFICGIVMVFASNLQQFGVMYSTVGKSGFITTLYIVLVPIFSLFLKRKSHWIIWISVAIAVIGLYFISFSGGFDKISVGDLFLIACAFCFTVHILVVDHFANLVDAVKLSCIQFVTLGVFSAIIALIFEWKYFSWDNMLRCWLPILYAGVGSCGIAFTLQSVGQKGTNPTIASLLMSLESVFSLLGGIVMLHETMTWREGLGCGLMFIAVVLTQMQDFLQTRKNVKKVNKEQKNAE